VPLATGDLALSIERAWPAFVLVAALLLLGAVADRGGLFRWAGAGLERLPGPPVVLLLAGLLLVAAVTAVLNLDTAVVFVTPVLVVAARRRGLDPRPAAISALVMANGASLLLPGANLTNLVVREAGELGGSWLGTFGGPAVAATVTTAIVLLLLDGRGRPDPALARTGRDVAAAGPAVGPGLGTAVGLAEGATANPAADPTLGLAADPTVGPAADPTVNPAADPTVNPAADPTVGPAVGPAVEPAREAVGGGVPAPDLVAVVAVLAAAVVIVLVRQPALPVLGIALVAAAAEARRARVPVRTWIDAVGPGVLAGLFALVVALGWLALRWDGPSSLLDGASPAETAGLAALATVLVNNLPATALLSAVPPAHPDALLVGLNLGPNLFVTGSLAAWLWWQTCRREGVAVRLGAVLRRSVPAAVASMVVAVLVLGG
jgi:Na+/H+ antiporter NhaD/arsenite permease-like protein